MHITPILALTLLLGLALPALGNERLREANFTRQVQLEQNALELKNQYVLTYLWVDVYAAAFYAAPNTRPDIAVDERLSQRLELYYFRDIKREDVIKAAWVTLERQHNNETLERLRPLVDALHQHFADIRSGDRYALAYHPDRGLSLERNGETLFNSADPLLARAYLGIWLAPNGLSDKLRDNRLASRE